VTPFSGTPFESLDLDPSPHVVALNMRQVDEFMALADEIATRPRPEGFVSFEQMRNIRADVRRRHFVLRLPKEAP
jgi:hypothetical protein